jgi:predicted nucleotide-binding protein
VGSSSGFAVALLTADDEGRARGDEELKLRGRQNVVFEFGFFVGLIGRAHTVLLYEEGVELPSDLEGLVYVPYDSGGAWRMRLAKELKGAGVDVDLNKAV